MTRIAHGFSRRMQALLGERFLMSMDERISHSFDATNIRFPPDAVAYARSTMEVCHIMEAATEYKVPVVARGAGAGFSGGAVPIEGGLCLVLTEMNRILSMDRENLLAEVEPGVITANLQREAESAGLFYPPDPASQEFSTIGGNIAECAGGLRAVKYGVTRDYVRALEAVLPSGKIIKTGARTAKSVTGYDLTRLLVGSEGTLAVITRAVLRLLPKPEAVLTLQAKFRSLSEAVASVCEIMASGVIPATLELLDRSAIQAVEEFSDYGLGKNWGGVLLVETDGSRQGASEEMKRIEALLKGKRHCEFEKASSDSERERLWALRRAVSPAINRLAPRKLNEDVAVPLSAIPELISSVREIERELGVRIVCFGHAGDGNIHVNLMYDPAVEGTRVRVEQALERILDVTIALGGTLSGEHGIGFVKSAFLGKEVDETTLMIMKRIKGVFDPEGILNPGKIFPQTTG